MRLFAQLSVMGRTIREDALLWAIPAWTLLSTALGRSFTALVRSPWDASLFAYIGSQWLRGRIPYAQVWDNKPPGIFAVNAAVFSIFPSSFTALAFVEGIAVLGCVVAAYLLLKSWGAPRIVSGFVAVAVAVGANLSAFNSDGNLTEIYVLWPAMLSIYFFTKGGRRVGSRHALAAGFFSGVAFLFKPVGLAPLLAESALIGLWLLRGRLRLGHAARIVIVSFAGAALAVLPTAIYFWAHGTLAGFVSASLTYDLFYGAASQRHLYAEPFIVADRLAPLASLVICALVGAVWSLSEGETAGAICDRRTFYWPLTMLWLAAALCGALAGGRNYGHYFLCLVPSLSTAAGLGFWRITEGLQYRSSAATFALVLCPLLFPQAQDVLSLRTYLHGEKSELRAEDTAEDTVAHYLEHAQRPGDTLFEWDYMPLVYFDTEMPCPTRLIDAHYLRDSVRSRLEFGPQLLGTLSHSPPTFIVDGTRHPEAAAGRPGLYSPFHRFLQERYRLVYTVGADTPNWSHLRVYERNGQ